MQLHLKLKVLYSVYRPAWRRFRMSWRHAKCKYARRKRILSFSESARTAR